MKLIQSFYIISTLATVYCTDKLQTKTPNPKSIETTIVPFSLTTNSDTTTTTSNDGIYVLKYPQQECYWGDYEYETDWTMAILGSSDPTSCASSCYTTNGCTGFEVGSNSGSNYENQPYCAHWLNDACKTPDKSNYDASFTVDTYTIVEPLDIFFKYSNKACPSTPVLALSNYNPTDCAKACLDSDTCIAFEMHDNTCKLRTNDGCTVDDLYSSEGTNIYFPIDLNSENTFNYYQLVMMIVAVFIIIIVLCCCACIRKNRIRDHLQHQCRSGQRANAVISILAARDVTTSDPEPSKPTGSSPVYTATIATPVVTEDPVTTTYPVQTTGSPVYTATIASNDITYPSIDQNMKMEV
jgi:hypothetical protein